MHKVFVILSLRTTGVRVELNLRLAVGQNYRNLSFTINTIKQKLFAAYKINKMVFEEK